MKVNTQRMKTDFQIIVCVECGRQWNNNLCLVCGSKAYGVEIKVVAKEHWEEACQHIEALLDDGADITQAGFFTKQANRVRSAASLYLSKFETIGVPSSTATDGKDDA